MGPKWQKPEEPSWLMHLMNDLRCHLKFRKFQSFSQYMRSLLAELLCGETVKQSRSNSDKDVINSSPPTGELIRSQMEAEALHSSMAAGNIRWCCRVTQVETDRVTQELLCTPDKVTAGRPEQPSIHCT